MNTPYSSEVLAQRTRDIAHQLGYTDPPVDSAGNFEFDDEYMEHLDHAGGEHPDWNMVLRNRPSLLTYWRRQSPDDLVATQIHSNLLTPGLVDRTDPPPILSGMVSLSVDPEGRPLRFAAIPPQKETAPAPPPQQLYDWKPVFALAGLDMSQFQAAGSQWTSAGIPISAPPGPECGRAHRRRCGWCCRWRGKPVFFRLISDTEPDRMPSKDSTSSKVPEVLLVIFLMVMLAGAICWRGATIAMRKAIPRARFAWVCSSSFCRCWCGSSTHTSYPAWDCSSYLYWPPAVRRFCPRFFTSSISPSSRTSGGMGRTPSSPGCG